MKREKSLKTTKPLWSEFIESWFLFFENRTGIKPKFDGKQASAMQSIYNYLCSVPDKHTGQCSPETGLMAWQYILKNWDRLDNWIKGQTDLSVINSKINIIINQFKNNGTNRRTLSRDENNRVGMEWLRNEIAEAINGGDRC